MTQSLMLKDPNNTSVKDNTRESMNSRILLRLCFSNIRIIIVIFAILFCTIYIYLGISILGPEHDDHIPKDVCTSKECTRTGKHFISIMDSRIDPCDDFHQYVCGRWPEEHPSSKDIYSFAEHILINDSIKYFKSHDSPDEPKSVRQCKYMFRTCIDKDTRNRHGYKPIYEILEQLDLPEIPTFFNKLKKFNNVKRTALEWIEIDAMASRLLNLNLFINCDIDVHVKNIYCVVPMNKVIEQNSESREDDVSKSKNKHLDFINFTVMSFIRDKDKKLPVDFNKTLSDAMDIIIHIENKIKKAKMPDMHGYFIINLKEKTYNNQIWNKYLHKLFQGLNVTVDLVTERITASQMKYFEFMFSFLDEESEENLELWIWWKVVYYLMPHTTTEAIEHFDKIFKASDVHSNILSEESCYNLTKMNMEYAVAYGVMGKSFQSNKKDIMEMWNATKEAFINRINSVPWLDTTTRKLMLDKLRAMNDLIGFSDTYEEELEKLYSSVSINLNTGHLYNLIEILKQKKKLSLERLHKFSESLITEFSPMEMNAQFFDLENAINVLPGYINYPIYNLGLNVLNYGSFGSILAHELSHGFDKRGINFDATGNYNYLLRNSSTSLEYEKRLSCFVQQYTKFRVPELNDYVHGQDTLNENIADNEGLHLAYDAYFLQKRNTSAPMLKLPGLENLTHEQLFFIAYATGYCGKKGISKDQLSDSHSPDKYRLLGSCQNSKEFALAYNCSVGSNMNPEAKCKIW